jgi:hypothetical protein
MRRIYKGRSSGRNLPADITYFDEMTPHSSYVLGVILGDGCVQHNEQTGKYNLNITCEDVDILDSANEYFGGQFTIRPVKGTKAHKLNIWSKELTELMFQKFGLRGEKSHNLPWIEMSTDMYQYFISGLHSTDGCNYNRKIKSIHKNKTYNNRALDWNYTSVCYDFIIKVKQHIENVLPDVSMKLVERTHANGNKSYCIHTTGKRAIKLCDWMYANTDKLTRCERKYQIYLPWKDYKFHH